MKKYLLGLVLIATSCAFGQNTNQFGSPAGKYCTGGPQTITDISVTPYQQYVCAGSDGHTWGAVGGTSGVPPIAGASAEYPLTEGTGTVAHDISGNGNDATFGSGSAAPTWYTYGISLLDTGTTNVPNQYLITPLTTFGSFYIAYCTPIMVVTASSTQWSGYPALVGPTGGTGGVQILGSTNIGANTHGFAAIQPSFFGGGNTRANDAYGGCHIYGVSAGTSGTTKDLITVDGSEIPIYGAQGASATAMPITGGTYEIGAAVADTSHGLRGVVSYVMFYPAAHTAAQMAQVSAYIQAKINLRPTFPRYPYMTNSRTPQALFVGDSLTASYQGSSQWTAALTLNGGQTVVNYALGGMQAIDMCKLTDQRFVSSIVPGQTVVHLWGGTNDIGSGQTAANVWTSLQSCVAKAHNAGAKIIVTTMIDRTGVATQKNSLNTLIRAGWRQAGFDAIDDLAMVPTLGADGANTNTACFQADKTHLTGPGAGTCATVGATALSGYGVVAAVVSNSINALYGSTKTSPDVSTSNALVETAANVYVVQTPTAAATASLPDCQGQVLPRTIVNGSATYAITISAINSQTITGSTALAANAIGEFTPELVGATTGGCYWLRTL